MLSFYRNVLLLVGGLVLVTGFASCGSAGPGGDDDDTIPEVNTPPMPPNVAPDDLSSFPVNESVVLEGVVEDGQTSAEQLSVEWISDIEGTLGMPIPDADGRVRLEHAFFVAVKQVITLRVSDPEGLVAEARITLFINTPPAASIESLSPTEPRSDQSLVVTGLVGDDQDDPRNLSIEWYIGDRFIGDDPADKNGEVEVVIDDPPAGNQTISLIVIDSGGLQGEDSVNVDVVECVDADEDGITDCDGDCDEGDPGIYPGAEELCDGLDQDCDGIMDEGFPDSDGDKIMDCIDIEECDDLDNDGDGDIDEGFDLDRDGFTTCDGDCDDSDAGIHSGVSELCDGRDQDCDGIADNGFSDVDDDDIADCVDQEECDGVDNDGDGEIDEGLDLDGDGYSACDDDCDDTNPDIYPGSDEVLCDGVDNDCDGLLDEDPYEPNELLDSAYYLGDLNETEEGGVGYFSLEASMHEGDGSDFYKFLVVDDFAWGDDEFYILIRLTDIPDGADYDLYLYWDDPDDWYFQGIEERESSESADNRDEEIYEDGTAGPDNGGYYWVEVRAVETAPCEAPYTLSIENAG